MGKLFAASVGWFDFGGLIGALNDRWVTRRGTANKFLVTVSHAAADQNRARKSGCNLHHRTTATARFLSFIILGFFFAISGIEFATGGLGKTGFVVALMACFALISGLLLIPILQRRLWLVTVILWAVLRCLSLLAWWRIRPEIKAARILARRLPMIGRSGGGGLRARIGVAVALRLRRVSWLRLIGRLRNRARCWLRRGCYIRLKLRRVGIGIRR